METASHDPNGIFAGNGPFKHRNITVPAGAGVLTRGTVLGRVTASDKYIKSASAAGDGSNAPRCILAIDIDATSVDVNTAAYFEGDFAGEKLIYGAGHSAATVEAALRQNGADLYVKSIGAAF